MPWLLIIDLVALLIHLALVYWVYRDALARYNRGAPWAVLAAIFPLGGWLFYLLYRKSPLVEFDRIDAELFDEAELRVDGLRCLPRQPERQAVHRAVRAVAQA